MTVCIALVCRGPNGPAIVECSDSRLDEIYASTDTANKLNVLGETLFSLLSGDDWLMARELSTFIREIIEKEGPITRQETFAVVKRATESFSSSSFCDVTHRVDLIVGGFAKREPILIYTGYEGGGAYTSLAADAAVIGSGSQIANSILKIRQYGPNLSEARAAYLAYEAKKYSENAPSVGPKTLLGVLYPDGSGRVLTSDYLWELENCRKKFGLQAIDPAILPDPQSTKDDPLPLPPLPESPASSRGILT